MNELILSAFESELEKQAKAPTRAVGEFFGGILTKPFKSLARFRSGYAGAREAGKQEVAEILKHKAKAQKLQETLSGQAKKIVGLETQVAGIPASKKWSLAKGVGIGALGGAGAVGTGLGIKSYREKSRKAKIADQLLAYHRARQ